MIEFRCLDCGLHVLSYDDGVRIARCASCDWITAHIPPEHEADARDRLSGGLHTIRQMSERR